MRALITRSSQVAIDLLVLGVAFAAAIFTRFDWAPPTHVVGRIALLLPYVVVLEYAVLLAVGVPRISWRYISLRDVSMIFGAMMGSSLIIVASRLVLGELQYEYAYLRHGVIPLGACAINFVLAFAGIVGVRVLRRSFGERLDARRSLLAPGHADPVPTILVGAGQGGVMVARELSLRPELGFRPVGFIDDDRGKVGMEIQGIRVLGTTSQLPDLCAQHAATHALITMASAPGSTVRRIVKLCEEASVVVKIIPGLYEIVGGRVNLSRIRSVSIDDLLRREPVALDDEGIGRFVAGRVVAVTGAGGSIGSELCRQIARFKPRRLVLIERAENALFQIHRELKTAFPDVDCSPELCDVTDRRRLRVVFGRCRPSAVFHAAAHKHVPMMEHNPWEAVKNNVGGTQCVADVSAEFGAEAFVMVSTDKAVNPTSVMGATKRVAEMYVQSRSRDSSTRFVTVRFGNVLGSNGSVVPIFEEQIKRGGPVTVTHPDMTRYFMTIPEACQLILQAASMGEGGEIFVLDMGEPVRIMDLARDMIELSGLREGVDVEIEVTGVRPGEKLFEELSTEEEAATATKHPKIFVGRGEKTEAHRLEAAIERLIGGVDHLSRSEVRGRIVDLVPTYSTEETRRKEDGERSVARDAEDPVSAPQTVPVS